MTHMMVSTLPFLLTVCLLSLILFADSENPALFELARVHLTLNLSLKKRLYLTIIARKRA